MGMEWVCFGHGQCVPEVLQKKVGTYTSYIVMKVISEILYNNIIGLMIKFHL